MRIAALNFKGEIPRTSSVKLPEGFAQIASNARLLSGDLEAWHDYGQEFVLTKYGPINSIHLMDSQYWLSWSVDDLGFGQAAVDVVLGSVPGDTEERTYFTGCDEPRVTNISKATYGPGTDYPYDWLKLGVPAPDDAPTVVVAPGSVGGNPITIDNPGAEDGNTTGWTSTPGTLTVEQTTPSPHSGLWYFAPTAADANTEAFQTINLGAEGIVVNQKVTLTWWQTNGADLGKAGMKMQFLSIAMADLGTVSSTVQVAAAVDTWEQRTLEGTIPSGAAFLKISQVYQKIGATSDAYIDDIAAVATTQALTFDGHTLDGWSFTPYYENAGAGELVYVVVDNSTGQPAPSFRMYNDSRSAFLWRDFGLNNAPTFQVEYDLYANYGSHLFLGTSKAGAFDPDCSSVAINQSGVTVYQNGATLTTLFSGDLRNIWLRVSISAARVDSSTVRLTVTVRNKGTGFYHVNATTTDIATTGKNLQFWSSGPDGANSEYLDNLLIRVDPPVTSEETMFTSYVVTWINEFGEESAPSDASVTVQRGANASVTITTDTYPPDGYGIVSKRIYRAVTSDSGTAFQLVNTEGDIPYAQADYVDQKSDAALGDVLESEGWDLPPVDGHNIATGANGITLIASKNTVRPSVAFRPHAYPLEWQLATDFDVVTVGAIDANFIVTTKGPTYIVSGDDPAHLSMNKLEIQQGCQSRRSGAYVRGIGFLYSGPDGLVACSAIGQADIVTMPYITPKEWRLLNPASIIAISHDDRYFGFYDAYEGGGERGGFIFDPRQGGLGWVRLDFTVSAVYVDRERDKLFLLIADIIYEWDKVSESLRPYQWKSKRYQLPRPAVFTAAQIQAADYSSLVLKLYAGGTLFHTGAVTSKEEFRIPAPTTGAYIEFEYELIGTAQVQQVQFAEQMAELM